MSKAIPSIPEGMGSPFYYNSLSNLTLFYSVPFDLVDRGVVGDKFTPMVFDEQSLSTISFQRYIADFGSAAVVVTELELSTVVVPRSNDKDFSTFSLGEFLRGEEQSLSVGFLPWAVACDTEAAVDAGLKMFGEPKFLANISSKAPSHNNVDEMSQWNVEYLRPSSEGSTIGNPEFTLECDLSSLHSMPINAAVVTTYGVLGERPIGSRWTIFQAGELYLPCVSGKNTVSIQSTDKSSTISAFLHGLERGSLVGVREHRSKPVAVRGRTFSV